MNPTTLNTIVGIVGAIVGIIGIIIGLIGLKSVSTAIKIRNSIKANTVQQAQVIKNGLDDYAVIRLSRATTQEELKKVIDYIQSTTREDINTIVTDKVKSTDEELKKLKDEVDSIPRFSAYIEEDENGGSVLVLNGGNAQK